MKKRRRRKPKRVYTYTPRVPYKKPNPRVRSNLCFRAAEVNSYVNGVKRTFNPVYNSVGEEQSVKQGIRVNLNGYWKGYRDSYCEVVINRSLGSVTPGRITGKSIAGDRNSLWTVSGEVAQCVKRFNTWVQYPSKGYLTPKQSSICNYATQKAYAKLSGPKAEVGLMVAEFHETLRFMKKPLASLVDYISDLTWRAKKKAHKKKVLKNNPNLSEFHKRNLGKKESVRDVARLGERTLNVMSESWLGTRYGALQLLYDVDALARIAAEKLADITNQIQTVRGGCESSWEVPPEKFYQRIIVGDLLGIDTTWEETRKIHQKSVTHIYYRDKTWMEAARNLQALGISPEQWLSLVYEATPLTFVLDWVVNFGSWIKSLTPKPTIEILGSSQSTTMTTEISGRLVGVTKSFYYPESTIHTAPSYAVKLRSLERTKNPELVWYPMINPSLINIEKMIDSLSLIWGRLPRIVKFHKSVKQQGRRPSRSYR